VKLAGQAVTILLAEGGKEILSLAAVDVADPPRLLVFVEESEDLGVWIRVPRKGVMYIFLLRWEYILGISLQSGMGRVIGMR
jgi:hypothetical protein